ncbi:MAG: hypothetical protein ACOZNI_24070 [Myxococcota bacterium]
MRLVPLALLLVACPGPKVPEDTEETDTDADSDTDTDADSDTDTDTDTDTDADIYTGIIVTSDYTSGVVATVTEDGVVTQDVLAVTGDTVVATQADWTFLLNRSSEDTVQMYNGSDFSAPIAEFSTGDGTNPQDARVCGDHLFVSLLAADHLGVYDYGTSLSVGTVDLSAFDDGDGSPEAGALWLAPDGYLYVALQQIDYAITYASADGSGTLVKVDCAAMEVVDSWDIGPNPVLAPHGSDPDKVWVYGGDYYLPDYSGPKLDGGIWSFDSAAASLEGPFLTEEDAGYNVGNLTANADGNALITLDDGYAWGVYCLDLASWEYTLAADGNLFVAGGATWPDGSVSVVQRTGFGSGAGTVGTVTYDLATCTATETHATTLEPYSFAIVQE